MDPNWDRPMPQALHKPFQVLWFETDDLAIIAIAYSLCLMFGGWFWLVLVVAPVVYMKVKKAYPRGFLKHSLYGIGLMNFKFYPSYFHKKFFE